MQDLTDNNWFIALESPSDPARNKRIIVSDLIGDVEPAVHKQIRKAIRNDDATLGDEHADRFPKYGLVIGRGKDDVSVNRLLSAVVSKIHCAFNVTLNGIVYLTDLGSAHRTTVRPSPTAKVPSPKVITLAPFSPVRLLEGDLITFGKTVISGETTHKPVELVLRYRYPLFGTADRPQEIASRTTGLPPTETLASRFISSSSHSELARLDAYIQKARKDVSSSSTCAMYEWSTRGATAANEELDDIETFSESGQPKPPAEASGWYGIPESMLYQSDDDDPLPRSTSATPNLEAEPVEREFDWRSIKQEVGETMYRSFPPTHPRNPPQEYEGGGGEVAKEKNKGGEGILSAAERVRAAVAAHQASSRSPAVEDLHGTAFHGSDADVDADAEAEVEADADAEGEDEPDKTAQPGIWYSYSSDSDGEDGVMPWEEDSQPRQTSIPASAQMLAFADPEQFFHSSPKSPSTPVRSRSASIAALDSTLMPCWQVYDESGDPLDDMAGPARADGDEADGGESGDEKYGDGGGGMDGDQGSELNQGAVDQEQDWETYPADSAPESGSEDEAGQIWGPRPPLGYPIVLRVPKTESLRSASSSTSSGPESPAPEFAEDLTDIESQGAAEDIGEDDGALVSKADDAADQDEPEADADAEGEDEPDADAARGSEPDSEDEGGVEQFAGEHVQSDDAYHVWDDEEDLDGLMEDETDELEAEGEEDQLDDDGFGDADEVGEVGAEDVNEDDAEENEKEEEDGEDEGVEVEAVPDQHIPTDLPTQERLPQLPSAQHNSHNLAKPEPRYHLQTAGELLAGQQAPFDPTHSTQLPSVEDARSAPAPPEEDDDSFHIMSSDERAERCRNGTYNRLDDWGATQRDMGAFWRHQEAKRALAKAEMTVGITGAVQPAEDQQDATEPSSNVPSVPAAAAAAPTATRTPSFAPVPSLFDGLGAGRGFRFGAQATMPSLFDGLGAGRESRFGAQAPSPGGRTPLFRTGGLFDAPGAPGGSLFGDPAPGHYQSGAGYHGDLLFGGGALGQPIQPDLARPLFTAGTSMASSYSTQLAELHARQTVIRRNELEKKQGVPVGVLKRTTDWAAKRATIKERQDRRVRWGEPVPSDTTFLPSNSTPDAYDTTRWTPFPSHLDSSAHLRMDQSEFGWTRNIRPHRGVNASPILDIEHSHVQLGSDSSSDDSPGPITPRYSLRPLKRSYAYMADEDNARNVIEAEEMPPAYDGIESSAPASKRLKTAARALGLIVLGAAIGSVGTVVGLMQMA